MLLNILDNIKAPTDLPHRKVHGTNGKQGEGVNLYHDGHKGNIEQDLDKAWREKKASVEGRAVSRVTTTIGGETRQVPPELWGSVCGTCEELSIEHIDCLVVPGILTLQVDGVQKVLDEGGQNHGE